MQYRYNYMSILSQELKTGITDLRFLQSFCDTFPMRVSGLLREPLDF